MEYEHFPIWQRRCQWDVWVFIEKNWMSHCGHNQNYNTKQLLTRPFLSLLSTVEYHILRSKKVYSITYYKCNNQVELRVCVIFVAAKQIGPILQTFMTPNSPSKQLLMPEVVSWPHHRPKPVIAGTKLNVFSDSVQCNTMSTSFELKHSFLIWYCYQASGKKFQN